ncbi:MAG TPA: hypothetical protein VM581_03095 [Magnetospirillaceae bacterium]|nr:hypothetical protein [Magnetospirillaceae bacterium]
MEQTPNPPTTPSPVLQPSIPTQTPSKKGLLIGGIIAGALVLLGGLGWWLTVGTGDAYAKGAVTYEANLKDAFLFYKNSTDTQKQMKDIKDKFDAALASRPKEPTILGIPLPAPAATKERLEEITVPFAAMRESFVEYHAFNTFADKALGLLDEMEHKDPLVDIHENEAAFNKAASDLRALAGPDGVTEFKNKKADVLAGIATQIGKAEAAFDTVDGPAYQAAEAEIKKLLLEINVDTAVDELKKIYRGYYDDLSETYEKAAEVLGVQG